MGEGVAETDIPTEIHRREARLARKAMGFRRFSMRGMDSAKGEWALICSCHNVRKLWGARRADRLGVIA